MPCHCISCRHADACQRCKTRQRLGCWLVSRRGGGPKLASALSVIDQPIKCEIGRVTTAFLFAPAGGGVTAAVHYWTHPCLLPFPLPIFPPPMNSLSIVQFHLLVVNTLERAQTCMMCLSHKFNDANTFNFCISSLNSQDSVAHFVQSIIQ